MIFFETRKAIHRGVEFENWTFSPGLRHEPRLKDAMPFSPGFRHEPGLKGLMPFSPGLCLKPRLKVPFSNSTPLWIAFFVSKKSKENDKTSKNKILREVVILLHLLVRKI